jgi:hypothetical protein
MKNRSRNMDAGSTQNISHQKLMSKLAHKSRLMDGMGKDQKALYTIPSPFMEDYISLSYTKQARKCILLSFISKSSRSKKAVLSKVSKAF